MKRRQFFTWTAGVVGMALASYYPSSKVVALDPESVSSPLFRFAALGNVGTSNLGQLAIAEVMNDYYQQHPFELVLMAGDNIYEDGEIRRVGATFSKPYYFLRKQGVPFNAVLGNHDVLTNNGKDQIKFSSFNMDGRYYSFTKGIVQYFALNTTDILWTKQQEWLEQTLAKSNATWKIVLAHHPLYSSGLHGSNEKLITMSPLFKRYGVQLYINGCDRNYERTEVIDGTTYLTVGAGKNTHPMFGSKWTAHFAARLSFATIDVYPQKLVIQGIGKNGKVFDRGKIIIN